MTLIPAWESYVRAPGWTEIRVILNNETSDWEGELFIIDPTDQITYRKSLVLPAHSYKEYRIPLFVTEGFNIQVFLRSADGTSGTKQQLRLHQAYETRVCVIADSQGIMGSDPLNTCGTTLLLQDLTALPETAMAWDTVDALIINGLSTTNLNAAQKEAMLAWVGGGGHLLLSGGPALPQTLVNLPAQFQIATPGRTQVFAQLAAQFGGDGEISAMALMPAIAATPILSITNTTLAVNSILGRGKVSLIGWDVVQTRSLTWLQTLWANDPIPAVSTILTKETLSVGGVPNIYAMLQIPLAAFPALWQWLFLFPIYLVLMGPGTWFIVRRLKRPILTWLLLPLWILLMLGILALALNGVFAHTFPLIREVATVHVPGPNLPARVVQGTVIYAPRTQNLTWESAGEARPFRGRYLFDNWYGEGEAYPLEVYDLDQQSRIEIDKPFGITTWGTEGLSAPPKLEADLFLSTQEDTLVVNGTVRSESDLREPTLYLGTGYYSLSLADNLPKNATLAVSQELTQTFPGIGWQNNICGNLGSSAYPTYPGKSSTAVIVSPTGISTPASDDKKAVCYITAIIDSAPFPLESIEGTHLAESCIIYTVPCPTQAHGTLRVPLKSTQIENGWIDEAGVVYLSAEKTLIPYTLPEFLQLQEVQGITIEFGPPAWNEASFHEASPYDPRSEVAHLALWDWEQQAWVEQPVPTSQEGLNINEKNVQRFFDIEQGVHLQITPHSPGGTYINIVVTIEGTW